MKRRVAVVIAVTALLLIGIAVALLRHSSQPATDPAPGTTVTDTIQSFMFSPKSIRVKVGTTVTWTNKDSVQHSIVSDKPGKDAPSGPLLGQEQSYRFTFTKPGTYTYHCKPHLSMHGTVIVTN